MKKIISILVIALFLTSCGSSRVCGGPGGKRCVEVSVPHQKHIVNA